MEQPVETQEHYHPSCHPRAGSHWTLTKPVTGRWDTELATSSTLVTSLCGENRSLPHQHPPWEWQEVALGSFLPSASALWCDP